MADSDIQNLGGEHGVEPRVEPVVELADEIVVIDIDRRIGATQHVAGDGVPGAPLPMGNTWRAFDLTEADWKVRIPDAALREFEIIVGALSEYDEPPDELSSDSFDWPATTDLMADVRARLGSGLSVVMLDECQQFDTNKSRRIQAANRQHFINDLDMFSNGNVLYQILRPVCGM